MNNEIRANRTNSYLYHHGHDDKLFLSFVQQTESKDAGSGPSQVQVQEEEPCMEDVNRLPVCSCHWCHVLLQHGFC